MMKEIYVAIIIAGIAAALFTAGAQGPRASSLDNWPGMSKPPAGPLSTEDPTWDGPRPSSEINGGLAQPPAGVTLSTADPTREGPRPSGH